MSSGILNGIKAGTVSQSIDVFIRDNSLTTGLGKTGLVFNTSGLKAYYHRQGAASAAITLATQTVTGAFSSGGFVEIDATNMGGLYRLDPPNVILAAAADYVTLHVTGTGITCDPITIPLEVNPTLAGTFVTGTLTTDSATTTITSTNYAGLTDNCLRGRTLFGIGGGTTGNGLVITANTASSGLIKWAPTATGTPANGDPLLIV